MVIAHQVPQQLALHAVVGTAATVTIIAMYRVRTRIRLTHHQEVAEATAADPAAV